MRKAHLVTLGLIITMLVAGSARIVAQQSASAVLFTPVSGMVNTGSMFSGTFMIQRFESRNNGAVAFGSVTGLLTTRDGVTRTVVTQLAIPMSISAGTATVATTPGVTPTSCGGVHLDLAPAAFQVLGTTVSLEQSGLDITTAQPDTAASVTQSTGFGVATGLSSIPGSTNLSPANPSPSNLAPTNVSPTSLSTTAVSPASQSTTSVVPTNRTNTAAATRSSTNTTAPIGSAATGGTPAATTVIGPLGQPVTVPSTLTSIGTLSPGIATPVQNTPATPVGSSPQFQQLVCSAGALSVSAGSGAQAVQLLNQMLIAMGG